MKQRELRYSWILLILIVIATVVAGVVAISRVPQ